MTGLLGTEDSIKKLAEKEKAELLVISDSHNTPLLMQAILSVFAPECDALCFCGDGCEDLFSIIELSLNDPSFKHLIPEVTAFCRGNNDPRTQSFYTDAYHQLRLPDMVTFTAAGKQVCLTHGHFFDVYYGTQNLFNHAEQNNISLVLYGHTHIANVQQKKRITVLNPGSCAHPRGNTKYTFATVTITRSTGSVDYNYFELVWNEKKEIKIIPYIPETDDFNLLW